MATAGGKSSPAVKVAVISVALSICIMLLAVSIVQGFRREIRDKITGFNSHIMLTSSGKENIGIADTPELDSVLRSAHFVTRVDKLTSAPVLLKTKNAFKGVYMRGVDKNFDFGFLKSNLIEGHIPDFKKQGTDQLLISALTAQKLQVSPGDTVNTYLVADRLRARPLVVAGIFDTHFESFDQYYIFGNRETVSLLSDIAPDVISTIEITTDNFDRVTEYNNAIIAMLNHAIDTGTINQSFNISTALEQGANYFSWLDLLDTNVYIILALMTLVAAFTLISGMLIIILEKVRFIGVLRSLGMSRRQLRKIFVYMAIKIGCIGLLCGNAIAIALILLQYFFHLIPLNAEAYFIDFVPVSVSWASFLWINAGFIVIIYLVLILPSQLAGKIKPSESMRFEE